jgi:transcriptional regulator with XRE-family HTH domain
MKITPQLKEYQRENERICRIFSARLKTLKEERGLSSYDIADILGISRQSVVYYTIGSRIPNIPVLVSLSVLFNVSVDYLLGVTDSRLRYPPSQMH